MSAKVAVAPSRHLPPLYAICYAAKARRRFTVRSFFIFFRRWNFTFPLKSKGPFSFPAGGAFFRNGVQSKKKKRRAKFDLMFNRILTVGLCFYWEKRTASLPTRGGRGVKIFCIFAKNKSQYVFRNYRRSSPSGSVAGRRE